MRIESLSDQIDLGPLVSSGGNLLSVSFLTPSVLEIDLKPTMSSVALGPDCEVERRERRFEFHDRGSDGSPGTYSHCLKVDACTRVDILPWAEARVRE